MRLFFALELAPGSKRAIDSWRERAVSADGRPVPAANFHVTLAFLGELDEGQLDRLCREADTVDAPGAGSLLLDRVGWWPRAGILWLGSSEETPALAALARALRRCGARAGAAPDRRPFVPHVTLYRNCRQPPPAPAAAPELRCPVAGFTLFQSRAGRSGVRYDTVAEWMPG